jgi:hypothetical protein
MVRGLQRGGVTASALIRLLARLTDADIPEPRPAFAERLSQWLGWTDAIALSAALNGGPATHAQVGGAARAGDDEAEVARVRAALAKAITDDGAPVASRARAGLPPDADPAAAAPEADFSAHRRRYLAQQQAMDDRIGPLRARLRARLAGRSPALARLAAVDEVMEQALGGHEQRLLAGVPALLERHFARLCRPEAPAQGLCAFRQDMQAVLLAELDVRLQPVDGLLEALRTAPTRHTRPTGHHD